MGRKKAKSHSQPDDYTCGPASLKTALDILGLRVPLRKLIELSRPTRNGTSVKNLIRTVNKLGYPVMTVEWATLRHLQSALRFLPDQPRAAIVNYQDIDQGDEPDESGHYAAVAGYSARNSRIILFDTTYGSKKKSYNWTDFIDVWYDYDLRRTRRSGPRRGYRLTRRNYNRLMMVLARKPEDLPRFTASTAKVYLPAN